MPKLGELPLFDGFFDFLPLDFPDLDNFWGLAKFWPFDYLDFLATSSLPLLIPYPTTSQLQFPTSGLDTLNDSVVFSIAVSGAAILLKL